MSRIDFVGLARQTAGMGTKVTVMEYFVPVERVTVNPNTEQLTIEETLGTRFPTGLDYGTRFFELPLEGAPRMTSLPRILSAFLGQPASAGTTGAYTHTFDPTLAGKVCEPHSLFVVRKDPNPPIVDLFWDARGNTMELSCAPNEYLRMNASFIALDLDDTQTAPTPTTDNSNRRKFSEVIVESSPDGTTWTAIPSAQWGITYNNNLDTDEAVLGQRKLYALPEGNADCEVRFTPRVNMDDYYRSYLGVDPTTSQLRMTATGADGAIVTVTCHAFEVTDAPAPIDASTVLKGIEVTGRCKAAADGKFVTIVVTNAVATYP